MQYARLLLDVHLAHHDLSWTRLSATAHDQVLAQLLLLLLLLVLYCPTPPASAYAMHTTSNQH
jgi:hypothetical protein